MNVIVLAAGTGSRLRPLTDELPKPLVRLAGKPLIRHTLDMFSQLEQCADSGIIVVGGYRFDTLQNYLRTSIPVSVKEKVTLLENTRYTEGNLITLITAMKYLVGDVLIMNADHVYPVELMNTFLDWDSDDIRIACDFDRNLTHDDMKVLLDSEGYLKMIHKKLTEFSGGYIGMTLVPAIKMDVYRNAILEIQDSIGNEAVVENVLEFLGDSSDAPKMVDLSGFGWLEIDTTDDLAKAEEWYNKNDFTGFWKA